MSSLKNIIDTHSHYDDPRFDGDRYALVGSLFERGMSAIIHAATDLRSTIFGIKYAELFPRFYTAAGIHPEYAPKMLPAELWEIEKLCRQKGKNKIVAVGEIGLDYHYPGYDRRAQIRLFREQILLAIRCGLPVIVHSRDASGDCVAILRELRPKGVMHCFSGSSETARELINIGMYISFTGVISFKNSKKARAALEAVPPDRLLLETDCPYMAPEPLRGQRCDSSMLVYTAAAEAAIRGVTAEQIILQTEKNARALFGI